MDGLKCVTCVQRCYRFASGLCLEAYWSFSFLQENGVDSAQNTHAIGSDADSDPEGNPLVVPLSQKVKPSKEQLAQQWFSQDVFAGIDAVNDVSDDEMNQSGSGSKQDVDAEDAAEVEKLLKNAQRTTGASAGNDVDDGDFEIVPAEASTSSDDSSTGEDTDYDTDDKAETLAYAKRMLRKKGAEDILDAAYNRYTFNDEGLPKWFADDESKHMRPQKPITKEEVEAMRAQFREINARPVKKVAEAKARKKRRAMKKLEQVRNKATAIADQADLTPKSKNSMMEKLYKKALATPRKPKRELVVAKKGIGAKGGKGRVIVDRRMKKDQRSHGSGKPGKGGGKGKKAGRVGAKGKGGGREAKGKAGGSKSRSTGFKKR